jgi:hypothetical protein
MYGSEYGVRSACTCNCNCNCTEQYQGTAIDRQSDEMDGTRETAPLVHNHSPLRLGITLASMHLNARVEHPQHSSAQLSFVAQPSRLASGGSRRLQDARFTGGRLGVMHPLPHNTGGDQTVRWSGPLVV